ncbi:probable protein phosphatase 2C 55 [Corylus avellana]|uniref:probable protein phosphatase 2C 55 n=1 Tax=Corylus avellana TaxID=13451 RepID=UPI001E2388D0|nr:probable protein phosphatase 2C 55 [Corylus avellana]
METQSLDSLEPSLKMVCGHDPLCPLGEDAYFVLEEKQAIGVANGVGGWAADGVDAGEYARELMVNASMVVHQQPDGVADLKIVLNEAFLNTKAKGSSTACIVMLSNDNILHSINVGDSGFMIFRANRLAYQSPVQQHYFNCPYQLGNSKGYDRPRSATKRREPVFPGDVIVVGTDGLLDNVFPAEIEDVLKRETLEGVNPMELAVIITNLARNNSQKRLELSRQGMGTRTTRGKPDDIMVVVAYIVRQNKNRLNSEVKE